MPRRPDEDPRITDLRRYKKAREQQKRQAARPPKPPRQRVLGSNPRAGLILVAVLFALTGCYVLPYVL